VLLRSEFTLVFTGSCNLEGLMMIANRPEVSVKEDVELLRNSPFFKGMHILGFVQNTETGLLKEIVGVD